MSESNQLPSIQRIKRDGTFSCFADSNFAPTAFTSRILNDNKEERQGMDPDMCLKMLSMYLETIDTDLREVVLKHQDKLYNQISDIKEMKTQYERINSKVESITSSFNSVKTEVNLSCKTINDNACRLANFNSVLSLLRHITSFRLGIKKIRQLLADNPTQRAWLRAQKTYQEIEKVFNEGRLANISCLSEDVVYYNEIRMQIIKNTSVKK